MGSSRLTFVEGPYVPRAHMQFRRWAYVFTERIKRDPASANLSPAVAEELAAAFEVFNEAYKVAQPPSTRTTISIAAMNAARKTLESMCRRYAQRIKNDVEVSAQVKVELHLHLGRRRRHRISAVRSQPMLAITKCASGRHELCWWDSKKGVGRAKPRDAAALQLFAVVADGMTADVGKASYVGTYTRQPIRVEWPSATAGKTISYFGRWITRRGEEGPWSLPASMQIAFGGNVAPHRSPGATVHEEASPAGMGRVQEVMNLQALRHVR